MAKKRRERRKEKRKKTTGEKIRERIIENKQVIKFCLIFSILVIPFYLVYERYEHSAPLYSYAALTAKLIRALLSLFGETTIKMGHLVVFKGFTLNLGPECTEASCLVMYLSSTLAYPTSFKKKGIGIAIGLPVFYIINILRIALLAAVGVLYQPAFDFVHLFFLRATFIVLIIIVWVLWIDKVVKR